MAKSSENPPELPEGIPRRTINSFVKRDGRITARQKAALDSQFEKWGLEADLRNDDNWLFDWSNVFGNSVAPTVEIGIGNGENLVTQAAANPDKNYLGIEVYRAGIGRALAEATEQNLTNLRVICDDAVETISRRFSSNSVAEFWLFFPDPWHKKRHHKRRIVQPDFADLLANKLVDNGVFHMATDWEPYAEHMLEVMENHNAFSSLNNSKIITDRPVSRIETHFEKRGLRKGHKVGDLIYRKC